MPTALFQYAQWVYNVRVAREQQKMKNEEMSEVDLIAILVLIRENAKANNELKTVEQIDKILDEIRK